MGYNEMGRSYEMEQVEGAKGRFKVDYCFARPYVQFHSILTPAAPSGPNLQTVLHPHFEVFWCSHLEASKAPR